MQNNWLTALPDYAVVEATLTDAQDFLQDQFCNDLEAIDAGVDAQINGYCNPKGRLLALFHILVRADHSTGRSFRIVLPASVAEGFAKRLSMLAGMPIENPNKGQGVLLRDVKINLQPQLQVLAMGGLQGVKALDSLLAKDASVSTLEPYQSLATDTLQVVRLPADRWLLLADADNSATNPAAISKTLAEEGVTLVDSDHWVAAAVAQGEAIITAVTAEKFIPQMLNMQSIDGLSFKKGCYPGQEIVARMQYLGKLKRNMRRIGFVADTAPVAGASVKTADDADLGTLVCVSAVAAKTAGHFEALAVLKADADLSAISQVTFAADEGDDAINASELVELELPYTVELPGSAVKA